MNERANLPMRKNLMLNIAALFKILFVNIENKAESEGFSPRDSFGRTPGDSESLNGSAAPTFR